MTFEEAANQPRSEKIILVKASALKRAKLFQVHSAPVYKLVTSDVVVGVKDSTLSYQEDQTLTNEGTWYYDYVTKTLYIRCLFDSPPNLRDIIISYGFFFSSAPIVMPRNVSSGEEVYWEPLVESIGSIGQRLDDQNTGTVIESDSSVKLINAHGYFDSLFDAMVWENQQVDFYIWFTSTPRSEAKKIFSGSVRKKSYSSDSVSFELTDFVNTLDTPICQSIFSEADGTVRTNLIGTPKRVILGKASSVRCAPVDAINDGYTITGEGTFTILAGSTSLQSGSSDFFNDLSSGDEIILTQDGRIEERLTIDTVTSSGVAVVTDPSRQTFTAASLILRPKVPSRYKNRVWSLSAHETQSFTTTVTSVIKSNRFEVASVTGFEPGDIIEVDGRESTIRRVSGNVIVTNSAVYPSASDTAIKRSVQAVYLGSDELSYGRDWTYTNSNECRIVLDELAEFNVAGVQNFSPNLTWNAGNTLSTALNVDMRAALKPRDWIRASGSSNWYEILKVDENVITLRTNHTESGTTAIQYKSPNYAYDDGVITADCYGVGLSGAWVSTVPDAVKYICNTFGITGLNSASFNTAKEFAPYVVSLVAPESIGDESPSARDVLSWLNESITGSIFKNIDGEICYSVNNSYKPTSMRTIRDDDILSYKIRTSQDIASSVVYKYGPYCDKVSGDSLMQSGEFASDYSKSLSGIERQIESKIYLYSMADAKRQAARVLMSKCLSTALIEMKSSSLFSSYSIGDKIYLDLDRLFARYGSFDRIKVASVVGISTDGFGTEIVVSDFGNTFNRVPSVAPNTATTFVTSSRSDAAKYGYILDDSTLTPDASSEDGLGNMLIG